MDSRVSQPSLLDPSFAPDLPETPTWAGQAQVIIDSPVPHLDREFDYGVPPKLAEQVKIGSRVRVSFGGRNIDGFVVGLSPAHQGADLKPIRRVVGPLPVLTPEVKEFCAALAGRYAGGLADVLRLAIPPRHASIERQVLGEKQESAPAALNPEACSEPWADYVAGAAYLKHLQAGQSPRAVWTALPSPAMSHPQWARAISSAAQATLLSGRGVLIIAPTVHDVQIIENALATDGIEHTILTADLGPSRRYENFLHILLGRGNVVVGTRAGIYAPVANLGLVVCWDEAHDSHHEPRAPYPHSRDALALRASIANAALLCGGFARTPEAQNFVELGWAHQLVPERTTIRARTARVRVADEYDQEREGGVGRARIPGFAWRKITQALESGPVLVQVPRSGYVPAMRCLQCHEQGRCQECHGTLSIAQRGIPNCSWCGKDAATWTCPNCSGNKWRATAIGAGRTAEELGRAFPGIPVRVSGAATGRLERIPHAPALIIATPGAEPEAESGYPLAALLDGAFLTDLPRLDAPILALHRWLRAASLTTGEVLVLGDPLRAPAAALTRWDPVGYARRELSQWRELGFPPARTVVSITGERSDIASFPHYLPDGHDFALLGPVPVTHIATRPEADELNLALHTTRHRLLITAPATRHAALTESIRSAVRIRSARREGGAVKVRVNPIDEL